MTIVSDDVDTTVEALKRADGKDMWLFGGGELFRSLLDLGLVDTIEVGVMPVVLGGGIPSAATGVPRAADADRASRYPKTGTMSLEYAVRRPAAWARDDISGARGGGARGEQVGLAKSVNHEGHQDMKDVKGRPDRSARDLGDIR